MTFRRTMLVMLLALAHGCGPSGEVDAGPGGGADATAADASVADASSLRDGGPVGPDASSPLDAGRDAGPRSDAGPEDAGRRPDAARDAGLTVDPAPGPRGGAARALSQNASFTADNQAWTPLTLPAVHLEAGESRALEAGFYIAGPAEVTHNVTAFGLATCQGPDTAPPGVWTTGNWIGADVEPGVQQFIHATVTAPVAGEYTCRLDVRSQGQYGNTPTMVLGAGAERTFLRISGPLARASAWHLEADEELLVGEGAFVLRQSLRRPASAGALDARADLELTTCNYATGNCSEAAWGPRGAAGSTVRTRLMVAQLDAAGAPCDGWITDPPSGSRTTFIERDRVHWKLHHRVRATVNRAAGCTDDWAVKLWVEDVSGNPIRTEAWARPHPYSQASARWELGPRVDLNEDGCADLIGRSSATGDLEWLAGDCAGGFAAAARLGTRWGGLDEILAPGDLTGDGCADVVARTGATLRLYRGSCAGGLSAAGDLGAGDWAGYAQLLALGDYDMDGCVDVGGLRAAGDLFLHRGDCAGGLLAPVYLGSVGAHRGAWGAGDWSGDGCADLLVRTPSGELRGHYGDCRRQFSEQGVHVGTGWNGIDQLAAGRDVDGDGCMDVLGRVAADGRLSLYRGDCAGGFVPNAGVTLPASVAGYDRIF